MATSGEYLRIWEVGEESRSVKLKSKLSNVRFYRRLHFTIANRILRAINVI